MTEILNGHNEPSLLPFQKEQPQLEERPPKPPRKKVSFHENVTDIDDTLDDTAPLTNGDEDRDFSLDSILNVSEKISFFSDKIESTKEKQPSSIPQARLAFVTGMVDSTCSQAAIPAAVVSATQDSDMEGLTFAKIFANGKSGTEPVVDSSSILEHREELRELWEKRMMADDNQSSPPSVAAATKTEEGREETVVCTSEAPQLTNGHADDDTSPDSLEVEEKTYTSETSFVMKQSGGTVTETVTVETKVVEVVETKSEAVVESVETKVEVIETKVEAAETKVEAAVETKVEAAETKVEAAVETKTTEAAEVKVEAVAAKTEAAEVKVEEAAETKTEALETKVEAVETKAEAIETKAEAIETKVEAVQTKVEAVETKVEVIETKVEAVETKVEAVETKVEAVEPKADAAETKVEATEIKMVTTTSEVKEVSEEKTENSTEGIVPQAPAEDRKETVSEKVVEVVTTKVEETKAAAPSEPQPILQIEESNQDGDGFVTLEDCLVNVEGSTEIDSVAHDAVDPQPTLSNGHAEPNSLPPTPEPTATLEDRASHPEIEEFVKSGGVKRIIPGVQKTEQPYSTCTTETKIAMEIREMREREEELRVMREQAALSPAPSPQPPAHSPAPSIRSPSPSVKDQQPMTPYRVSSVFGRGTPSPVDERQIFKGVAAKETAVEREIRLARDREEELRKQKGLPPREDDSYVKPSQVKSSQVRVFGKANVKQAATAKIQLEIEEQTQREIALRETGSIQTISHERTDAKVAKLNTTETNGSSHPANGYLNGRSSPEKRPAARPASIFSQGVSMQKFIASKGAPRPTFVSPTIDKTSVVKKNVESKIQQEIMEMKRREEELKLLHKNSNGNGNHNGDSIEHEMNQKNNRMEYENGHDLNEEDISPRHNKLIAQWEQRIQKAES